MTTPAKRVLFYVQHLLGVGHVRRAALIADAMQRRELDVHIAYGGAPVSGIEFRGCTIHHLPEARAADVEFSGLVDAEGHPISEAWKTARRDQLLALYDKTAPGALLIEQFPFGRRQFRFELLPLLERARSSPVPPKILCSVRDILVSPNNAEKIRWITGTMNAYFDGLVVHGDPSFITFDQTFPEADALTANTVYSGYVTPPLPRGEEPSSGAGEVIVAAGGGAVGEDLLRTAVQAKPLTSLSARTWRILTGPNLPAAAVSEIKALGDSHIIVEPNRKDYPTLLSNCVLSISQGGYNTLMDLVQARCPSVVVPFSRGNENEQQRRTRLLAARGFVVSTDEKNLSPETLATAIEQALTLSTPDQLPFKTNGAEAAARIVENLLRK